MPVDSKLSKGVLEAASAASAKQVASLSHQHSGLSAEETDDQRQSSRGPELTRAPLTIKIPQVARGMRGTFFLGLKSALEVRRLQVAMPNEMLDVYSTADT